MLRCLLAPPNELDRDQPTAFRPADDAISLLTSPPFKSKVTFIYRATCEPSSLWGLECLSQRSFLRFRPKETAAQTRKCRSAL